MTSPIRTGRSKREAGPMRTCRHADYEPMTAETVAVLECELPATHGGQCRTSDVKILKWEDWL